MFGYIVPAKSELKVREFEIYNAYYCAVCRAVRARYGQLPRLMLTFDSAFLALLLAAVCEGEDSVTEFRCAVQPLRKKNLITNGGDATGYAADILVLLGYSHLDDDRRDEHRLRGLFGTLLYRRAYRKAKRRLPGKAAAIEARIAELAGVEGAGRPAIDEAAEPFAKLMEEIMDGAPNGDTNVSRVLRAMGYNLGKWIYLIDAADDLETDSRSGSFNPLKGGDYSAERLGFTLEMCLAETAKAFELLRLHKNEAILKNIIYVGLRLKTDEVLAKYGRIAEED
ncbi:MAG: DUF5685 family protein [Clostridiales Family XIII bacterium]|jgi:hypothetical protein|nr:DUF5685 family protein [Clostridiales Family XIII bacterium]